MNSRFIIISFLACVNQLGFGQNQAEEIARLKKQLAECQEQNKALGQIARHAEEDAKRKRYSAQSKAMALKSLELKHDLQLQSLVAQQAYQFYKENSDGEHDNDIYNGLYYALRNNNHPLTRGLAGHERGTARSLITHKQNALIYSGGSDGKIIQWSQVNGLWQPKELVNARSDYQVYTLALSQDETLLIAAGLFVPNAHFNYLELYDLTNPITSPRRIQGFTQSIENVVFMPDGKGIFVRDNGRTSIKISDFSKTHEVIKPPVKINAIALNAGGTLLAGAGDNGSLYIWAVNSDYSMTEIKSLGQHLTAVAWHPKGNDLIVGNDEGLLRIIRNGLVVRKLAGHDGPIEQINYNHAGTSFSTASKDKTIRLWNLSRLTEPPIKLGYHLDWAWCTAFTSDDKQLMVSLHSAQQTVMLREIRTEESIRAYPTSITPMTNILCTDFIKRNMTLDEWETFVGADLPYVQTCKNLPPGK